MLNNDFDKKKEIAFLLDGFQKGVEISEIMKEVFSDWETRDVFWDEENNVFFSLEGDKETFYPFILDSALVVNLLDRESSKFTEVGERLEAMKTPHLQNSLKTITLFASKLGTKMILQKHKIQTPVFEKIGEKTEQEIFQNFPQPANIHQGLVEEVIDGQELELLLFKNDDEEIFCLNSAAPQKAVEKAKEIFEKLNIERFALMSFISSQKRGLYLLDIFVDLDVLIKDKGRNLKKIKKVYK